MKGLITFRSFENESEFSNLHVEMVEAIRKFAFWATADQSDSIFKDGNVMFEDYFEQSKGGERD